MENKRLRCWLSVLSEGNVRNFIFKGGFPQVPEYSLEGVWNTSVQRAGSSVYTTDTFVIICRQFFCSISRVEIYKKRRKYIWEGAVYSSIGRCFEVLAGIKPLIPGATTQLCVRNSSDFSLFQWIIVQALKDSFLVMTCNIFLP